MTTVRALVSEIGSWLVGCVMGAQWPEQDAMREIDSQAPATVLKGEQTYQPRK